MKYLKIALDKTIDVPWMGKADIKDHIHITRNSPTIELILVTNGILYLEQDGQEYEIKKGDVFFSLPNIAYGGGEKKSTAQFHWIHFSNPDAIEIVDSPESNDNYITLPIYFHLDNISKLQVLLSEMNTHFQEDSTNKIKCILLKGILGEIEYLLNTNIDKVINTKKFFDIVEYLCTNPNLNEFSSIKKLAHHFGYNEKYLTRLFKENLGINPKDLLVNIKIGIAKSYLTNSEIEIKEIAYYLGYNEAYFLKVFKKKVGITPTQYRRAITSNSNAYRLNINNIINGDLLVYNDEVKAIKERFSSKNNNN